MSTNSTIIVKVRKNDVGKTMKFSKDKLPCPLEKWNGYRDEANVENSESVKLSEYIGIYCHWDGDESGVGVALKDKFNDYDSILNLVLGGFCSSIKCGSVRHFANRKGEEWKYIKPTTAESIEDVVSEIPNKYIYLYDEENGWRMKVGNEFKPYSC